MPLSHTLLRSLAPLTAFLLVANPCTVVADFLRGDANRDSRVNVSDAVTLVVGLFRMGELPCADAADSNDDGALDLSDALATLHALFAGDTLSYPSARSGPDLTCDVLGCRDTLVTTPAVLLSELHYHPDDILDEFPEFLELYNRTDVPIDLEGYRLTDGVRFEFPTGTLLAPASCLLVAKDTESRFFRSVETQTRPLRWRALQRW